MQTTFETGRTARRARGQTARPTIFPTAAPSVERSTYLRLLRNRHRQGKKVDEALCVLRVVSGHGKAGESLAIERIGRSALGDRDVALVEFETHRARDALLRRGEVGIERLALRREPRAVIDQLGVTQRKYFRVMRRLAIEAQRFEFAMRGYK